MVVLDNGESITVNEDSDIDLSYALNIHKSQGSEYDEVDIVIPKYASCVTRKMLYTAVTRAKNKVRIWLTEPGIYAQVVRNIEEQQRSFICDGPGNTQSR